MLGLKLFQITHVIGAEGDFLAVIHYTVQFNFWDLQIQQVSVKRKLRCYVFE